MGGAACAVIIVTSQATAASAEMNEFARDGRLTDELETKVEKATRKYLKELETVAAEIPT